jgi:hypothetical protein
MIGILSDTFKQILRQRGNSGGPLKKKKQILADLLKPVLFIFGHLHVQKFELSIKYF